MKKKRRNLKSDEKVLQFCVSTILSQRDRCTRRKLKAFSVLKSYLDIIEEIIENFPFLIVELSLSFLFAIEYSICSIVY